MDKAFKKKIGRNLEVYVDDLVIKIHKEQEILKDIEETFQVLRKINMKLNPKKCTFKPEEGMFLGHGSNQRNPVNRKILEANADLFCQSCTTSPGDQLYPNGKTDTSLDVRLKEAKKILPCTYDSGRHRLANQANLIAT
ncbi:reverse transcriptase domain-containing protein [Tanacetum coccineum]